LSRAFAVFLPKAQKRPRLSQVFYSFFLVYAGKVRFFSASEEFYRKKMRF